MSESQTFDELMKKLRSFPPHTCCDDAEFNVLPPHGGSGWVAAEGRGRMRINANPNWHIEGEEFDLAIRFCPYCGVELPQLRKQPLNG